MLPVYSTTVTASLLFTISLIVPLSAATIDTFAGTGSDSNNGDHGAALAINIKDPFGVEVGPDNSLYVTEVGHHRIRRVDMVSGRITTVAGNGKQGFSGDGGKAVDAELNEPYEVRFDGDGNMYFVEMQNHVIRRVDAKTNAITTVAGTGEAGFGGDGGPASKAQFRRPHSIALDERGGLYVADIGNHRIRHIDLGTGSIKTIVGNGKHELPQDGMLAEGAPILGPRALCATKDHLWIALREGNSVWRLDLRDGRIHHIAGSGETGSMDGDPKRATFHGPKGIAIDSKGNALVVDTENQLIRKIDAQSRMVSTVAGNGKQGADGDRRDALRAELNRPHGICVDSQGTFFIGDTLNHKVRIVRSSP